MSVYLPPAPVLVFPPPSPLPPPLPWRPPPALTPTRNSHGGVIAGVSIAVGMFLFLLSCMYSLALGHRHSRTNAAAAAAMATQPRTPPEPDPWGNDELQLRSRSADEDSRPRRAGHTASLPSFTYDRSMKRNVTGEEARTCSICLGAFQIGEAVRLLPMCLHLYHVECIDPWLDVHSSCPICRSGTDASSGIIPPV